MRDRPRLETERPESAKIAIIPGLGLAAELAPIPAAASFSFGQHKAEPEVRADANQKTVLKTPRNFPPYIIPSQSGG